jgi:hypothetical protein
MPPSSESTPGEKPDQDQTAPAGEPARAGEVGSERATLRTAVITGTLLSLVTVLVLYALVQFWPPAPAPTLAGEPTTSTAPPTTAPPATNGGTATTQATTTTVVETTIGGAVATTATTIVVQPAPNPPVRVFWTTLDVDREGRLFVIVALAGALGGLVYALRSLSWFTGNRSLKYSWLLYYVLLPVVGAALATITYVVLRGGLVLVTTQTSPDVVNPFGFAALAALAGLFSREATEWLKRVFEQVLTPAMKGKDAAVPTAITDMPQEGPVGATVRITGTGLADVTTVTFNQVPANFKVVSDTEIQAEVPAGGDGPIRVASPAGAFTTTWAFTVKPPEEQAGSAATTGGQARRGASTAARRPPGRKRRP